jgi:D-serine deaminase-like pyridoxal phosphate-dependent protein
VDLRPHAKTHKSPTMAKRQIADGAVGVCVAKASEVEVFSRVGIDDIAIAHPVIGEAKLNRLRETVSSVRVTLVGDSTTALDGYAKHARELDRGHEVLAEVDTDMH